MSNTIHFDDGDLPKIINQLVKDDIPNRDDIIGCLVSIVEAGYSNTESLVRAKLGLVEDLPFSVGDTIYVNMNNLYLGSMDIEATKQEDLMLDDNYIKGVIVQVNKFSHTPYRVEIRTIATDGKPDNRVTSISVDKIHDKAFKPAPGRLNVGDIL